MHPFEINREAFNDLFKEYYPGLRSYAQLLIESEFAEDVVQEVFLYIWENKEAIVIHTSIKAYLFRAVYTRCLNHISRQKMVAVNHLQMEAELKEYESIFFDPDKNEVIRTLYANDLRDQINEAIDSLPKACREVFTLSYIEDRKNKEISEILNISISTVEKHINHALKTLRPLLKTKLALLIIYYLLD